MWRDTPKQTIHLSDPCTMPKEEIMTDRNPRIMAGVARIGMLMCFICILLGLRLAEVTPDDNVLASARSREGSP